MSSSGPAFVAGIGLGITASSVAVVSGVPGKTIALAGIITLAAAFVYNEAKFQVRR